MECCFPWPLNWMLVGVGVLSVARTVGGSGFRCNGGGADGQPPSMFLAHPCIASRLIPFPLHSANSSFLCFNTRCNMKCWKKSSSRYVGVGNADADGRAALWLLHFALMLIPSLCDIFYKLVSPMSLYGRYNQTGHRCTQTVITVLRSV